MAKTWLFSGKGSFLGEKALWGPFPKSSGQVSAKFFFKKFFWVFFPRELRPL